jgi:hypothetical protein
MNNHVRKGWIPMPKSGWFIIVVMILAAPAMAQTTHGIGGVAAIASVQSKGLESEHLSGPLGGNPPGVTGVVGGDFGRVSLLGEVSFAGSISGPQEDRSGLGGRWAFTTVPRDILWDLVVRINPMRSHRIRVQPAGGIGFVHDATQHTQIVVTHWFFPGQPTQTQPDQSFTKTSLDLGPGHRCHGFGLATLRRPAQVQISFDP